MPDISHELKTVCSFSVAISPKQQFKHSSLVSNLGVWKILTVRCVIKTLLLPKKQRDNDRVRDQTGVILDRDVKASQPPLLEGFLDH